MIPDLPLSYNTASSTNYHLDVLRQPPDALAVSLAHHDRTHEDLDGSDTLEWDLALTRRLVHAQLVAEFVLGHGVGVVNLVAQDNKGNFGQLLHREERIQLSLSFGEALVVFGVNEKDDAINLGKVILPKAAS